MYINIHTASNLHFYQSRMTVVLQFLKASRYLLLNSYSCVVIALFFYTILLSRIDPSPKEFVTTEAEVILNNCSKFLYLIYFTEQLENRNLGNRHNASFQDI